MSSSIHDWVGLKDKSTWTPQVDCSSDGSGNSSNGGASSGGNSSSKVTVFTGCCILPVTQHRKLIIISDVTHKLNLNVVLFTTTTSVQCRYPCFHLSFFSPFFIQARVEIKSGVPFPVLSFTLVCVVAIVVFALPRVIFCVIYAASLGVNFAFFDIRHCFTFLLCIACWVS